MRHDLNETVLRLSVLDDPARGAAYLAVRTAGRPVTRAEVTMRWGSRVRLAAFHLEKLLAEGFVESTYGREEGSVSVGHPAKRYRPTALELEVSIPPRRYELAAVATRCPSSAWDTARSRAAEGIRKAPFLPLATGIAMSDSRVLERGVIAPTERRPGVVVRVIYDSSGARSRRSGSDSRRVAWTLTLC